MNASTLGELEQQIMDIIWECNTCSARDTLIKLEKNRKIAYTTVTTILQRLCEKGLLKRAEGKSGYIYSPQVSKESFSKNVAQSFLKKFINSFGDTAIASFAESIDSLPVKKKEYFIKLLEAHDTSK